MIDRSKEYILCAAILFDTEPESTLICGFRHDNCIHTANQMYGMKKSDGKIYPYHQGFLTSKNRYVDRKEAASLALAAGQIANAAVIVLFSEDLY